MNRLTQDRAPWLFLAAGIAIALLGVRIVSLPSAETQSHSQDVLQSQEKKPLLQSQAIPLSALKTLVDSPTPGISAAALALVNRRLGDQKTYRALISSVEQDLDSPNEGLRHKARLALAYLEEHVSISYLPPSRMSIASTTSPANEEDRAMREELQALETELLGVTHRPRTRARPARADMDRRRQRREAMLFHEGSGELSEGDIIELNSALAEIVNRANV